MMNIKFMKDYFNSPVWTEKSRGNTGNKRNKEF